MASLLKGIYVDKLEQLEEAWDEAFAAKRSVVLDIVTDPNHPISLLSKLKTSTYAMLKGRDPKEVGAI